jgi:hypothetical protein
VPLSSLYILRCLWLFHYDEKSVGGIDNRSLAAVGQSAVSFTSCSWHR